MNGLATILVVLVALEHFGFAVLEMFFWDHPRGRKAFGTTPELSAASRALAANQGLYNAFVALGLLWGVLDGLRHVQVFFLGFVIVAGVFGALTVKRSIVLIQSGPATLALTILLAAPR